MNPDRRFPKSLRFVTAAVAACGLAVSLNVGAVSAAEADKSERATAKPAEVQTPSVGAEQRAGKNPAAGATIKASPGSPEQGCQSNSDNCNQTLANLACGGHSEDPDGDGNYTCKDD